MTAVDGRLEVRLDLYPARLFVASTSFSNVRVIVTPDQITAWRLGPSGPEVVWQRAVTGALDGRVSSGVNVPTDAGDVWVEQSGGCGCGGAALRDAVLYPGVQVVMTGLHGGAG